MSTNIIILNDIKHLPLGTNVTIRLNKTASMRAVSFGNKFGLCSGEFKTADEIKRKEWQVILGWI